jgi:hypothetical protein
MDVAEAYVGQEVHIVAAFSQRVGDAMVPALASQVGLGPVGQLANG